MISNFLGWVLRSAPFALLCLVLIAANFAHARSDSAANISPAARLEAIDQMCMKQLGVRIVDLSLLVEAKRGQVFLISDLQQSGRESSLDILVKKGYVKTKLEEMNGGKWVQIVPTAEGQALIDTLRKSALSSS